MNGWEKVSFLVAVAWGGSGVLYTKLRTTKTYCNPILFNVFLDHNFLTQDFLKMPYIKKRSLKPCAWMHCNILTFLS